MAKCPNCDASLLASATECKVCGAVFDSSATWLPLPESEKEEITLEFRERSQPLRPESNSHVKGIGWTVVLCAWPWVVLPFAFGAQDRSLLAVGFTVGWCVAGVVMSVYRPYRVEAKVLTVLVNILGLVVWSCLMFVLWSLHGVKIH